MGPVNLLIRRPQGIQTLPFPQALWLNLLSTLTSNTLCFQAGKLPKSSMDLLCGKLKYDPELLYMNLGH